jgi:hypothetical protein
MALIQEDELRNVSTGRIHLEPMDHDIGPNQNLSNIQIPINPKFV